MGNWALIKNNTVHSVIVADADFVKLIKHEHDHIVEVPDGAHIGSTYENGTFYPPPDEVVDLHHDELDSTANGEAEGFESFNLPDAKFPVRYSNGFIRIGCIKYKAKWLRLALTKVCKHGHDTFAMGSAVGSHLFHNRHHISRKDGELLLAKLEGLKL